MRILLASESPRRKFLLTSLGYNLTTVAPMVDELEGSNEISPKDVAVLNAQKKARKVVTEYRGTDWDVVIAADTVVVIDNEILGKPHESHAAKAMLERLSHRTHQVITGFFIINRNQEEYAEAIHSRVTFRALSNGEIEAYLASKEGFDKAGGYAIQGIGAALIDKIEGSLTNIIGLPVEEVLYHAKRLCERNKK